MPASHLLIFGHGYTGAAVSRLALAAGWQVTVTQRRPVPVQPGLTAVAFDAAGAALATATHVLITAAPGEAGDPVLAAHGAGLRAAGVLRWIGYLSTTGVYGDRQGGWVDEATPPAPTSARGQRRLQAEQAWGGFAGRQAVDLIRLAGIYGPGRSAFDDLHAGTARRIIAPGHLFGRIHRDDIAGLVLAAAARQRPGVRVLNGNDDLPAASADVIAEAARLLGIAPPEGQRLEAVWPAMSPMARSFWSENRRVASGRTQDDVGRRWTYPSYREGLAAIFSEVGKQGQGAEPP